MSEPLHCNDGCDLSLGETLALLRIGLEPGDQISEIDFPDSGREIATTFIYPPIPNRNFDWSAVFSDSYDGAEDSENRNHIGFGPTEEAARADLIENYSNL